MMYMKIKEKMMNVETAKGSLQTGVQYEFSCLEKKMYREEEEWTKGDVVVYVTTTWRNGTWFGTLTENEITHIEDTDFEDICISEFEDVELDSYWDHQSTDYEAYGLSDEEEEKLLAELEDADYVPDYLDVNGFECEGASTHLLGPLHIALCED